MEHCRGEVSEVFKDHIIFNYWLELGVLYCCLKFVHVCCQGKGDRMIYQYGGKVVLELMDQAFEHKGGIS